MRFVRKYARVGLQSIFWTETVKKLTLYKHFHFGAVRFFCVVSEFLFNIVCTAVADSTELIGLHVVFPSTKKVDCYFPAHKSYSLKTTPLPWKLFLKEYLLGPSYNCEADFVSTKLTLLVGMGNAFSGFAELQMDELDVVDSFGTVPFLDYKHFALRTFFPEVNIYKSFSCQPWLTVKNWEMSGSNN